MYCLAFNYMGSIDGITNNELLNSGNRYDTNIQVAERLCLMNF